MSQLKIWFFPRFKSSVMVSATQFPLTGLAFFIMTSIALSHDFDEPSQNLLIRNVNNSIYINQSIECKVNGGDEQNVPKSIPNVTYAKPELRYGRYQTHEDECLRAHNDYRSMHGVGPLILSRSVSSLPSLCCLS